nr:CDP-alcohol phosphatidyltransferase family protein [Aneurinibacillus sp. XH2]
MNLPNTLTLLRFALVPVYLFVFFSGHVKIAFFIIVIAGATDVLDGHLARSRGMVTDLGVVLDPLADKTMMLAVFVSLLISGMIPWEAAAAIMIRDAGMIAGSAFFHFRGKKTVPANSLGKLTTVLYYIAILMLFFGIPYAIPYLWAVIAFSFITSAIYILKFRLLNSMAHK